MKTKQNQETLQALKELKKIMKKTKDKRVYAMVAHVSSSGMSRDITFRVVTNKGELLCIDPLIKKITGYSWGADFRGVHVGGCGMDMIFNTLYVVNSRAISYGIIKKSKNVNAHDLQYKGLVNSNYWSL